MFAKAVALTISSEMSIYIDKYHNTVIGGGEKGAGSEKEGGEREKEGEQKKEKEE